MRRAPYEEVLTLRDLLKDPIFRKWFSKVPKGTPYKPTTKPWCLMVKQTPTSKWAKQDFWKYSEAFNWLARNLSQVYDAAIVSKRQYYKPPLLKTKSGKTRRWNNYDPPYVWCPRCRRPTRFGYFKKHHLFANHPIDPDPYVKRCTICGVKQEVAVLYY